MKNNRLFLLVNLCLTLTAQGYSQNWITGAPGQNGFEIGADWLYWKANESGLELGYFTKPSLNSSGAYDAKGYAVRLKEKWTNGYRVYGSAALPCSEWEIGLSYAYLPSHSCLCGPRGAEPQYFYRWYSNDLTRLIGIDNANHVEAKWDLKFSYGDLDFAQQICLNSHFSLKPHIGVRGLWINQTYNIHSRRMPTTTPPPPVNSDTTKGYLHLKDRTEGYGIEGGLWVNWQIVPNLSIIGQFGGAILYSRSNINSYSADDTIPFGKTEADRIVQTIHLTDRLWQPNPMLDYFIGVQYARDFCNFGFAVRAGWEQHVVFDTNYWFIGSGNLGLQGLTLGGNVSF